MNAKKSTTLLSTYGFVIALLVLLANDLVLKRVAGGFVTGKLSDFAGLFVFALFWSALLPRYRTVIHWVTAAAFVWWKLPVSGQVIDFWNGWAPFAIGRTEDPTDLVALIVLVGSHWFSADARAQVPLPALRWATIPVALFSFVATTMIYVQSYDRTYLFRAAPADVRQSLDRLGIVQADSLAASLPADSSGDFVVRIPTDCCGNVIATLHVAQDPVGAAVTLRQLRHGLPGTPHDSIYFIGFFERCLVQRLDSLLSDGRAVRPAAVDYPASEVYRQFDCG